MGRPLASPVREEPAYGIRHDGEEEQFEDGTSYEAPQEVAARPWRSAVVTPGATKRGLDRGQLRPGGQSSVISSRATLGSGQHRPVSRPIPGVSELGRPVCHAERDNGFGAERCARPSPGAGSPRKRYSSSLTAGSTPSAAAILGSLPFGQ